MMTRRSFSETETDVTKLRREYAAERKQRVDLEEEVARLKRSNETLVARCNELANERSKLATENGLLRAELVDPIVELERVRRNGPAAYETQLWTQLFTTLHEITTGQAVTAKRKPKEAAGYVTSAIEVKK